MRVILNAVFFITSATSVRSPSLSSQAVIPDSSAVLLRSFTETDSGSSGTVIVGRVLSFRPARTRADAPSNTADSSRQMSVMMRSRFIKAFLDS